MKTKTAPKARPERPSSLSVQDKLIMIFEDMDSALIERTKEIKLVLRALLCRENPLLVGPPGTGKSFLLDNLMRAMDGTFRKFDLLFNKFTTPEEVFGLFSINGMKQDVYRRVTTGRLPEAHFGFGDEIFKASPAILNTTLKVLNERTFDPGDGTSKKCPLMIFVAASNEYPQDMNELAALFDRFLFRGRVLPIQDPANRRRFLFGKKDHTPQFRTLLGLDELFEATEAVKELEWTKQAEDVMFDIIHQCNQAGIFPGDRRQLKAVRACQASAFLAGADIVEVPHLDVLSDILWDDPQEQPDKVERIVTRMADPVGHKIKEHKDMMEDVLKKVSEPKELAAKLQDIQRNVEVLANHPKKQLLLSCLEQNIRTAYGQVMGVHQ